MGFPAPALERMLSTSSALTNITAYGLYISVIGGKDVAVLATGGAEVFVAVAGGGKVSTTVDVATGIVAEAMGKVGIAVGVMTGGRGVGAAVGCGTQATRVRITSPKAALFFISLSPQVDLDQVHIANIT
jgi:hypothetical protein